MAKGHYMVRTNSEWNSLTFRFTESRDSNSISITMKHFKIPKDSWNSKSKSIRKNPYSDYDEQNNLLARFKTYVQECYNRDKIRNVAINKIWLESLYYDFFKLDNPHKKTELSINICEFLDSFINTNPLSYSKNTIKNYKTLHNILQEFQNKQKENYSFKSFGYDAFVKLINYCNNDLKYGSETIRTHVQKLKATFKYAYRFDIDVSEDYLKNNFIYTHKESTYIYLNEEDIEKIKKVEYIPFNMYDNARDWLLIGYYTAQRVSDLFNLNIDNINIEEEYIKHYNKKTKKEVTIPFSEPLKEILKKYNFNLPRVISDGKYNEYIKKVCEKAGINEKVKGSLIQVLDINGEKKRRKVEGYYEKWKLITSHTTRRSFITNHINKPEVKPHHIMKVTGHTKTTMLDKYNQIEDIEAVKYLNQFIK